MKKIEIFTVAALVMAGGVPCWTQDLASVRKALESRYALTVTTADKTDIVKAGDVLVLKKNNLTTVDVKSLNVYQNKYVNGRITPNLFGSIMDAGRHLPGSSSTTDRKFVTGEKVWVTGIDVTEKNIVFTLFTDAYNDTRYGATLRFPFAKGKTPTVDEAMSLVAEVFDIQPQDNQQASGGSASSPPQGGQAPVTPVNRSVSQSGPAPAAAQAEAPPPPIAPPPPPPADPKTINLGQTIAQVKDSFGPPEKVLNPSATKQIYVYKDMKVTFVGGKVTDVQ